MSNKDIELIEEISEFIGYKETDTQNLLKSLRAGGYDIISADSRPVQTPYAWVLKSNIGNIFADKLEDLQFYTENIGGAFIPLYAAPAIDKILPPLPADLVSGIDASLKQQADTPDAVEREAIDKGSEGMVTVPLAFPNATYKTEKLVAVPVEMLAGNPSKWPKNEELTPTDAEMEAALKALEKAYSNNYGTYDILHDCHMDTIRAALTKKSTTHAGAVPNGFKSINLNSNQADDGVTYDND